MRTMQPLLTVVSAVLLVGYGSPGSAGVQPFYALENGDTNGDWQLDLSDGIHLLSYVYMGGSAPVPIACGLGPAAVENGDVNGDGSRDLTDGVVLFRYLFAEGLAPVNCDGSALLAGKGVGAERNPNPRLIPVDARPYGTSYGEWSARWWQWAGSVPAAVNPVTDTTGAHCDEGQSGPVWFLAGTFGGEVERACTVPAGKAIFFPLVNFSADNLVCVDPDTDLSFDELRELAAALVDGVANLSCVVDGASLSGLEKYRVVSPEPFTIVLPPDDVFAAVGCVDSYPREIPSVADGFFLMLAPLSSGAHTIVLHGELPDFGFVTGVTYRLTVE